MRKVIFLFIAFILVAVSIDWIHSCADLKSHKEVFGRHLTYAEMYEYKDKDYDYLVRVPSFFNAQPDSLQEEKGRMRFDYADQWITLVIESHVINSEGMSLQAGMDSLAQVLHATNSRKGKDYPWRLQGFCLNLQGFLNSLQVYFTNMILGSTSTS